VLSLVYSAGLAAVHRENWPALRAVTSDAQTRDQTGRKIPLIGVTHVWMPFASAELAANVLAFETDGSRLSEAEIEGLRTGTKGKRLTPVSDHLHGRLRPLLSPIIHDDADYDDAFDELEVLLAVVAADAASQAELHGQYLHGPWAGAFAWRRRYERQPPFEQQVWARRHEALLSAGLFGADATRAKGAFEKFVAEAQAARSRRF
jgi:transposase